MFLINIFLLPLKLLVLPIYLIFALLALLTGLIKGISKLFLGFFSFAALSLAIIGFFTHLPIALPMFILFITLSAIPILLGIFPFIFTSIASLLNRFLHFHL